MADVRIVFLVEPTGRPLYGVANQYTSKICCYYFFCSYGFSILKQECATIPTKDILNMTLLYKESLTKTNTSYTYIVYSWNM